MAVPFPAGLTGRAKLVVCALYFILGISSIIGLKHYALSSYSKAGYGLSFAFSLYNIYRYTAPPLPNDGEDTRNSDLVILATSWERLFPVGIVTMFVGQLMNMRPELKLGFHWMVGVAVFLALVFPLIFVRECMPTARWAVRIEGLRLVLIDLWMIWDIVYLARFGWEESYDWALGMSALVCLNHFLLGRLSKYFYITELEISTVGMIFSIFFTIRATQEILLERAIAGADK